MTPTPCRVAGYIISIRPTYSAPVHLLVYLHSVIRSYAITKVYMAFLFRENRRHGTEGQTDRRGRTGCNTLCLKMMKKSVHNKHIGRHNHVRVLIHFLPIFDRACTKGWRRSYAAAAAGNYWRRRQPDLTAANRITDGGAAEGSIRKGVMFSVVSVCLFVNTVTPESLQI